MDRITELESMSTRELESLVKAGGSDASVASAIINRRKLCPWA